MVREVLSEEVTLKWTAKGREDTEPAKIKGERIPDGENKVELSSV